MKILSVVSEIYPLVKTGGLGDVAGALPLALREHNVCMVTLVPGYPAVMAKICSAREVLSLGDLYAGPARVLAGNVEGLDLFVLDAPHLFARPGNPYSGPDGLDWPDNAFRFGALSWVAARIGLGEIAGFVPDVVHCHDWQAGMTPAYLALQAGARPSTVITIHNLAYQGKFPVDLLSALRLPPEAFRIDGVEYYGSIGFLKAGLQFADRITTVSPGYAREIQTPEGGLGLDGLLRLRSGVLSGIINGIDIEIWNPQCDARIPVSFGSETLSSRAYNTTALRRRFGLTDNENRPLMGVVSRLVWQKGIDILADAVPALLAQGAQFAILGTGERDLEQRVNSLAAAHRGHVGSIVGYDEDLAHLLQSGADVLLVPSRFEPCGVTQLCAMRYGAVPVVAKVGGLADTVADIDHSEAASATGFHISPVAREALEAAGRRVSAVWADQKRWRRLQQNGMGTDVSWKKPAARYARLYGDLVVARH